MPTNRRSSEPRGGAGSPRSIRNFRTQLESVESRCLPSGIPPAVGGDPSVNPADFRVTVFARGLDYPTGVTTAADGSLLVVTNKPSNNGTNFYDSTTQVVRLTDANGDGVA